MKEGDCSEQIYRTSSDGSSDVVCITCHLKNKNIRFSEKSNDNSNINDDTVRDESMWDVWKQTIRSLKDWKDLNNRKIVTKDMDDSEIEIGINGQMIYKQCNLVHGTISPSSRYLVALCLDENGIPPSLWLLDVSQGRKVAISSNNEDSQQGEGFGSHYETKKEDHTTGTSIKPRVATKKIEGYIVPPLLLHSQTKTRLVGTYRMLINVHNLQCIKI